MLPSDCTAPGARCGAGFFCDPILRSCRAGCRLNTDCPGGATCDAMTNQCACAAMQHACGQTCVPDTAITSCGTSCQACAPPPTNGVAATCQQGACSFTCVTGYTRQGAACVDVDECLSANGGCATQATCTNTPGARTCACNSGFSGDGFSCTDINECQTANGGCAATASCTNTPGARTCACLSGYSGDGLTCTDINECQTNNGGCSANATCTNTPGSRTCACRTGFSGDGGTCVDIDECLMPNVVCSPLATCINAPGSFACTCNAGYAGDGGTCADVDECLASNGGCSARGQCLNTIGSRLCHCSVGYAGTGLVCDPTWTLLHFNARRGHGLVYDSARARFVLFGGDDNAGTVFGDTWESSTGLTWTQVATAGPAPRTRAAMAYDPVRQRVVLFGGEAQSGSKLGDTWEWDGRLWLRSALANEPPARSDARLAFDTPRARVVLFGGQGTSAALGDTWDFNGVIWRSRSTTGPSARIGHSLTSTSTGLMLFGGTTNSTETWEWNGTSWALRPLSYFPPARSFHAAAWDSLRQRVVITGGSPSTADTWTWNGTTWTHLGVSLNAGRSGGALAFEPTAGRMVAVGGIAFSGPNSTIEVLDAGSWDVVSTLPATPAGLFVFDSTRRRSVSVSTNGVSEFDGSAWSSVTTTGPSSTLAAEYDPSRGVTLVASHTVGYYLTAWDGGTWQQLSATDPTAFDRYGIASTFNTTTNRLVLFGGKRSTTMQRGSELLEWSGTWQSLSTSGPPGREAAGLAFDPVRNRLVLFGGEGDFSANLGDTWLWNGSSWLSTTATGPGPRRNPAMQWDPVLQRVMLYGGTVFITGPARDLWSWNGTAWTQVVVDRNPGPDGQLEYDVLNRRLLLANTSLWYRPSD